MATDIDLNALLPGFRALASFAALRDRLSQTAPGDYPLRLARSARPPMLAALAPELNRPIILMVDRQDTALAVIEELGSWAPDLPVHYFAEPNPIFYERSPWGPRTRLARLRALDALLQPHSPGNYPLVVASARALLTRTVSPQEFKLGARTLRVGQIVRQDQLLRAWHGVGYVAASVVTAPGEYSRRGGILDVWPPTARRPVRIEFFDDEIEQIRQFDPSSQRSEEQLEQVRLTPAREAYPKYGPRAAATLEDDPMFGNASLADVLADLDHLRNAVAFPNLEFYMPWLHSHAAGLLDFAPPNTLVIGDDHDGVLATIDHLEQQALDLRNEQVANGRMDAEAPLAHLTWSDLQDQLSLLCVAPLTNRHDDESLDLSDAFAPGPRFGGQLRQINDHLLELSTEGQSAVVVSRQAARLSELWRDASGIASPALETLHSAPAPGEITFVLGTLERGFVRKGDPALHLLTDSELFGWSRPEPRRSRATLLPARAPEDVFELTDFRAGDYVVHLEYGIGQYLGLVSRTIDDIEREYLHVAFAEKAELYVPIHHADRLTKYVGADDRPPLLSRLGTSEWSKARERTRKAVEDVARELLALYATRASVPGFAFPADDAWQREMEASFAYIETPDQLSAIGDVKTDMERPYPMDRLLCGDVGYGKTEVALRAAFKAVNAGKQVAVLVPTTILAQQHYDTFVRRLAAFPVQVEMLSRFRSARQQSEIVRKVGNGEVDILIGTHRLLSTDVTFNDLGLLVVDEEQRFGVAHKEKLKRFRTEVDVLTLTATPIPRTLYMSLTGVRDISTINTPPEERLPVITHVGPYDERLIRQAILRELDRGGQVFFVHNRVQTIRVIEKRLKNLLPGIRLGIGHGQMKEAALEKIMRQFVNHEIDVLLSTSIIESGVDIPNANTLIVDRADTFGLAQLYQIRGRVGRGANRAYAYFFYLGPQSKGVLTHDARLRLETLAEQTELGAGYNIAMRDLEIRGAGELLGNRQSGHIQTVGFHLYTRLLRQAVRRLGVVGKEDGAESSLEADLALSLTSVDLPIAINIPVDYIGDRDLRLKLYRRLAGLYDEDQIEPTKTELTDRFGPPPPSVEALFYQMQVKFRAQRANVETIGYDEKHITLMSPLWHERDNRRALDYKVDGAVKITKGKLLLPRHHKPRVWQRALLDLLDDLAHVRYPTQVVVETA